MWDKNFKKVRMASEKRMREKWEFAKKEKRKWQKKVREENEKRK